jgi:hypothetical protein
LYDKFKWLKDVGADKLVGISPDSLLFDRSRDSTCTKAPILGGIFPLRASSFPRDWIRSELINITRNHDSYYKDSDLFRVGNQFTHDMDVKRLGINPLVKRCGINPALWFLVVLIMMSKLVLKPE